MQQCEHSPCKYGDEYYDSLWAQQITDLERKASKQKSPEMQTVGIRTDEQPHSEDTEEGRRYLIGQNCGQREYERERREQQCRDLRGGKANIRQNEPIQQANTAGGKCRMNYLQKNRVIPE